MVITNNTSVIQVSPPVRNVIYASIAALCSLLGIYCIHKFWKPPPPRIGRLRNGRKEAPNRSVDILNQKAFWDQLNSKDGSNDELDCQIENLGDDLKEDISLNSAQQNQHSLPLTRTSLIENLSTLPFYDDTAVFLASHDPSSTSFTVASSALKSPALTSDTPSREIFSSILQVYMNGGKPMANSSSHRITTIVTTDGGVGSAHHRSSSIFSNTSGLSTTSSASTDMDILSQTLVADSHLGSDMTARDQMERMLKAVEQRRRRRHAKAQRMPKCSDRLFHSPSLDNFNSSDSYALSSISSSSSTPSYDYQSTEETEDFSDEEFDTSFHTSAPRW